ncbi:T9SS type B sorting domain-containing protein [Hydrotalea flava]|uniref:T9SS type B sorting domain-containing protein n=1 Tax=Hydrotalea flava TaxID=714549 RepID=UPI00082A1D1E|nr:T9SS type B sorting domain-containing protein [Hydrotalea flava]
MMSFMGMVIFFSAGAQSFQFEKGFADFPFTYNNIAVTSFGSGSFVDYGAAWSSCGVATKPGSIWLGAYGPASFTNTFSQGVNDMVYNINAADTTETFTFSVNRGNVQISILSGCADKWTIAGNQLTCKGVDAGTCIQVHASEPFTNVTIEHNGLMDGSLVTLVLDEALKYADNHTSIRVQPIAAQKICLGNAITDIPVTITGDPIELAHLSCLVTSSNQTFLPDSAVQVLGANGNRLLHFTATPAYAGVVQLQLTIQDNDVLLIQVPIVLEVMGAASTVTIDTKNSVCKGEKVTLKGTPANGVWSLTTTVISNGAATNLPASLQADGTLMANYPGSVQLYYAVKDSSGCTTTTSTSIQVHDVPVNKVMAPKGTILCEGSQLQLMAPNAAAYQWFKNQQPLQENAQILPVNTPGNYGVKLTDTNGCSNPAIVQVTITGIAKPKVGFSYTNYCANLPVQFQNLSDVNNSGPVNFEWTDDKGNTSNAANPAFTYASAGDVKVQLKITSQVCIGFTTAFTKTLHIDRPDAGKLLPVIETEQTAIRLQTGRVGVQYQWQPATAFVNANTANPLLNVTAGRQQYTVMVTAASGCTVTDTVAVNATANAGIYVANVFSPNGDGQNDRLLVNLIGYNRLNFFRVYDRKGRLLFQTADEGNGWDGTVNGTLQPIDTYVWVAEASNEKGQRIYREGSTTLLR